MAITEAVVLAAGEGRRLRPLTYNRPKPMLPVAHRPIIEHVLDSLIDGGIERIAIVVGYRGARVKSHFGPTYRDIPIEFINQRKQLGSAHALLQARGSGIPRESDRFLVVNGDQLYDPSLVESVVDRSTESTLALGIVRSDRAAEYGAVRLDGDRVTEFVERPETDTYRLLNAGIYSVTEEIFSVVDDTERKAGELAMSGVIDDLLAAGDPITGIRSDGWWDDATYPWDLLRLTEAVLSAGRMAILPSADEPHTWIAPSATVHETATIRPPAVVGPDATVGPMSVVGPTVAIGRNVTVGAGSILERSLLDADARIGPGSTLVEAVIGQGVVLGAENTVAGGPAEVRIDDRIFRDRPLGAVIADRATTAGAVTFAPGTLVGPAATVGTGASVEGVIDRGQEVR